ncbi:leucine-rich repeat protein [Clostridium sp. chh4-2]|uniref:leucine-rich repeat protein n=1 Tax=Clostridium sp. chh4-2 TaxID=2067550 RepID=UPI0015E1626F|nr:leucine-rich repeat protein [Clostridium sp. chh4-2]
MKKRLFTVVLAGMVAASSLYFPMPRPSFAQTGGTGERIGTASNAEYPEEDGEEDSELEDDVNLATDSDAEEEELENDIAANEELKDVPEKTKVQVYSADDLTADDMFSFSRGEIQGFSKAYLEQLEEDEEGFLSVDLVIPDEINGAAVTEIGSQAFDGSQYKDYKNLRIRSIDLSQASELTQIKKFAFDAYSSSTTLYADMEECELNLPDSLTEIGECAFRLQKNLKGDLDLTTITKIGSSAFEKCGFDGNLMLPDNEIYTAVEGQTFYGCSFTGTLEIPDHITEIKGNYAFSGNHFDRVILNNNITLIGGSAFQDCTLLESISVKGKSSIEHGVTLPDNLITLENRIIENCAQLTTSFVIPDATVKVGSTLFAGSNIKTVYGGNNVDTKYGGNFLFDCKVTAFILPSKEVYDLVSPQMTSSKKSLCAYPMTVTFTGEEGNSVSTIEALYNRPINYRKNEETLVWEADNTYVLPEREDKKIGFDVGWGFSPDGTAIKESSLVSGLNLYPVISLSTPTVVFQKDIDKTYDGKTSYLEVEAFQPITKVDSSYYLYYFLGSEGGFTNIVYKGTAPIHYGITDVADSGVYPVQIQFLHKENGSSVRKWLYSGVAFMPRIKKADATLLIPVTVDTAECPTSLSDISIALPEEFPSGKIEWEEPDQQLTIGSNQCGWIYTPDNAENFTQSSYRGTTEIIGVKRPEVTNVTVTPGHTEAEPGQSIRFTARVEGVEVSLQGVNWSVQGSSSVGTVIDSDGVLKIADNETAGRLTVTAASTYDSTKIGTADVTVNPKVILYTLTFDSRGGSAIAPISDLIQGTVIELPAPLREGYQFDGWYSEPDGGTKFDKSITVSSDITVYAHWTLIKVPDNSGSDDSDETGEMQSSTVSIGVTEEIVSGKVNTVTVQDGGVKAVVTADDVDKMIQSVKAGQDLKKDVIHIAVASGIRNANETAVSLPHELDRKMQENNVSTLKLSFENQGLEMNLTQNKIQEMNQHASAGIRISAQKIDSAAALTADQNILQQHSYHIEAFYEATGKPVVLSGNEVAEIAIPYVLKEGETADKIIAVQIKDDGTILYLENSRYDPATRKMIFGITEFGTYSIAVKP